MNEKEVQAEIVPVAAKLEVLSAKYMASAVRVDQYPEGNLPQFAFVGRSNVGKSSLINSLCRHRGLARISGTPGKTQTLNFYQLEVRKGEDRQPILFVDLPGYGYAKRAQRQRTSWGKFIEDFLMESPELKKVFQLIDIRHPAQESDLQVYDWLIQAGVSVQIIATKADKLGKAAIRKQQLLIEKQLKLRQGKVMTYSSLKGTGREEVLDVIDQLLLL